MGEDEIETPLAELAEPVETVQDAEDPVKEVEVLKEGGGFDHWEPLETDPPMRETAISCGERFGTIRFNHVTSFIGIAVLWGASTWCMIDDVGAREQLVSWRSTSALYFSWFYIGTRPVWLFFMLYMAYRFGDIRLGPKDAKPEFTNTQYFTMLFSAGVAVGLFFYGVSEPMWHQTSHWFANSKYHNQDEIDQFAINQTLWHWGPPGWAGYILVAVTVGVGSYKYNLPLTLRSSLYPILGKYTWGWIGDFIDGFTIVMTVAGVCTSLGLGAMQILAGLQRVNLVDFPLSGDRETNILVIIIWVVTFIATGSVVSGLNVGIKHLSNIAFFLGQLLLIWALIADQTAYILNLFVQSIGYYLQYSNFLINFWTDAFGQLRPGEGRAIDGEAAAVWWMDSWTVVYMAWWTSWSGFVGLFVARISKGRTLRDVILFGMFVPFLYICIWFCVFGGIGIRQARVALELEELGKNLYNDTGYFLAKGSTYCYDVPQNGYTFEGSQVFETHVEGVTPVCKFNPSEDTQSWFNVLFSFSFPNDFGVGFGYVFSVVSLIAMVIYFVTSSDSGSLVVDHLSSNGQEEHHWIQRVFWALTEGAVASALLIAGKRDALSALQAGVILSGLPFTITMCYMQQSLWIYCTHAEKNPDAMVFEFDDASYGRDFTTPVYGGILNIFETIVSLGIIHPRRRELGLGAPKSHHVTGFFLYTVAPFVGVYKVLNATKPKESTMNMLKTIIYTIGHILWVGLAISTLASHSLRIFAWTVMFINAFILSAIKAGFRENHNIRGHVVGDYFTSLFAFPQVVLQLVEECDALGLPHDADK